MKHTLRTAALGAAAVLWLAAAQAATPSPQFLGTWQVDLSTLPPPPPAPPGDVKAPAPPPVPKSVTVNIKDAGGGKWLTEVITELADGTKNTRPGVPVALDGTPTPISGNPRMDTVSVTSPDPHTTVITFQKDGKTVQTETSKLAADGKSMVMTIDATGPGGRQMHRTETLNKK